jgi:hypothetical protein
MWLPLVGDYTIADLCNSAAACAIAKATELPAIEKTQDPTYDTVDLTIWVLYATVSQRRV